MVLLTIIPKTLSTELLTKATLSAEFSFSNTSKLMVLLWTVHLIQHFRRIIREGIVSTSLQTRLVLPQR